MKVSKSLLQAIAMGVALGGATASCTLLDNSAEVQPNTEATEESGTCGSEGQKGETYNCPACGIG